MYSVQLGNGEQGTDERVRFLYISMYSVQLGNSEQGTDVRVRFLIFIYVQCTAGKW